MKHLYNDAVAGVACVPHPNNGHPCVVFTSYLVCNCLYSHPHLVPLVVQLSSGKLLRTGQLESDLGPCHRIRAEVFPCLSLAICQINLSKWIKVDTWAPQNTVKPAWTRATSHYPLNYVPGKKVCGSSYTHRIQEGNTWTVCLKRLPCIRRVAGIF